MPVAVRCPFYIKHGKNFVQCEGCSFTILDHGYRRQIFYAYCASPEYNYKNCMFYKALFDYYERMDEKRNAR